MHKWEVFTKYSSVYFTSPITLLRDGLFFLGNKDFRLKPKATNMASNTPRSFHLFNCDNLCKLSEVEALLEAVKGKIPFKILHIKTHEFRREQIEEIFVSKITNLGKMDYAVFVVHAAEACLSFSDDSGYGKIYGALKERTGSGKIEADATVITLHSSNLIAVFNPYVREVSRFAYQFDIKYKRLNCQEDSKILTIRFSLNDLS